MKVNGIQVELPRLSRTGGDAVEKKAAGGFSSTIADALNAVNGKQVEANRSVEQMLTGKNRNIHETMIAMEKADISLKLMVRIRNKALDSYKRILTMK